MSRSVVILSFVAWVFSGLLAGADAAGETDVARPFEGTGNHSSLFVKNVGQWPENILFRGDAGGAAIWITRDGVLYQFNRVVEPAEADSRSLGIDGSSAQGDINLMREDRLRTSETWLVRTRFVEISPDVEVLAEGLTGHRCNFFLGNDPSRWRQNVPEYESVTFRNLYDGIDFSIYGDAQGNLMYSYTVASGADLQDVKIEFENSDGVFSAMSDGFAYSTARGKGEITLATPAELADPAAETPLFSWTNSLPSPGEMSSIEPTEGQSAMLAFSTYLGGSMDYDIGKALAADAAGCVYVTGETCSQDFPIQNARQLMWSGANDAFVTKYSSSGDSLIYSTYVGGWESDWACDIAVDSSGCAYVTGGTVSADFPTQNAFDSEFGSVWDDVFVFKLSASGDSLIYSTYIGGHSADGGHGICVDRSGCAYVTGYSGSDFPMANAYDASWASGDAFISKLSASGESLLYSTFLGGSDGETGFDIAVDGEGCVYVVGDTYSPDLPVKNCIDSTYGGNGDAFVAKFSSSGSSLIYCTYLGGSAKEHGHGIAVDNLGCSYVTGSTGSLNFPVKNPFDSSLGGTQDAFVTKLSATGSFLEYSTYLGGSGVEEGEGRIAVDNLGCAYVTGTTASVNYPTRSAFDATFGGYRDAFVTKLAVEGDWLVYSTFLGGSDHEVGYGIAVDESRCAYVTGGTLSVDFPLQGAYDASHTPRDGDAFVTKFVALGTGSPCCGLYSGGYTGNTNCDVEGQINLADITVLVDNVYVSKAELCCDGNGNVDGSADGKINLADITRLINRVYLSHAQTAPCQ